MKYGRVERDSVSSTCMLIMKMLTIWVMTNNAQRDLLGDITNTTPSALIHKHSLIENKRRKPYSHSLATFQFPQSMRFDVVLRCDIPLFIF